MVTRASGARAQTLMKFQTNYDTVATGNFTKMPFTANTLGGEQNLIDDPVLGAGRDPDEALLDVLNVAGDITVPVDPRYAGLWLKGLFGAPTSSLKPATGQIVFSANPSPGDTITINGVTFNFDTLASTTTRINIKASLALTLDEAVTVLNASSNSSVTPATYSHVTGSSILDIVHDTNGTAGNTFTLAASAATVSGTTLDGGNNHHIFTSGQNTLPAASIEVGNPDITKYRFFESVKFNSLALTLARSGAAAMVIGMIARGQQAPTSSSQGGTPQSLTFSRISQFKGYVKSGGLYVGSLTAASMNFSNNLESVQTIRDDDRIEGADEGITSATGSLTLRLSNSGILSSAEAKTAVDLEIGYKLSPSLQLRVALHKNTLSIPKAPINGPGGIEATINYQAFRDSVLGRLATVTLINDLDGTQY